MAAFGLLGFGALLGQLAQAQAQTAPKQYTECFGALIWPMSATAMNDAVAAGEKPTKLTRIPAGWTPVGGGGRGGDGIVILCR